jgi:hypothetical protein
MEFRHIAITQTVMRKLTVALAMFAEVNLMAATGDVVYSFAGSICELTTDFRSYVKDAPHENKNHSPRNPTIPIGLNGR